MLARRGAGVPAAPRDPDSRPDHAVKQFVHVQGAGPDAVIEPPEEEPEHGRGVGLTESVACAADAAILLA